MILPKDIKTRHKIRDAKIVQLLLHGKTQNEVGQMFGITHQAISSILYKNSHLLTWDKNVEKLYRLNRLKRIAESLPDDLSKNKDILDVQIELRKEMEGDKSESIGEKTIVNVYIPSREPISTNSNRLETAPRTAGSISSE